MASRSARATGPIVHLTISRLVELAYPTHLPLTTPGAGEAAVLGLAAGGALAVATAAD